MDLRHETSNSSSIPDMGCKFSQVHVRLPSNTEGAIPRLWDVRRRMEELKTSPDTVVMYGAIYCLLPILPEVVAQWILNTVLRKVRKIILNNLVLTFALKLVVQTCIVAGHRNSGTIFS